MKSKSLGLDEIQIELSQVAETEFVKILPKICQQIWKTKHGLYTPIFKEMPGSAVTIGPLLSFPTHVK